MLKTKAFILEKFLDTGFRPLLRFLPESSDGFFEPPLELFSLERKGRPLPDGLFVYSVASLQPANVRGFGRDSPAPTSGPRGAQVGHADHSSSLRMSLRSKPLEISRSGSDLSAPDMRSSAPFGPRREISFPNV